MLTKVGGVALGVHGLDQGQAAARQLWTGQVTEDFTQLAGEAAARQFGADRKTAFWAGVGLDLAVPLIAAGHWERHGLAPSGPAASPSPKKNSPAATPIERHVGKSEEYLRGRLASKTFKDAAASTYPSLEAAEDAISRALRAYDSQIRAWASAAKAGDRFEEVYDARKVIGRGILRQTGQCSNMTRVVIRLRRIEDAAKPYFLVTSFPAP